MTEKHVIEIEINDDGNAFVTVDGKKWTSVGYGLEYSAAIGEVLGVDLGIHHVDIRTKAKVSIALRRVTLAKTLIPLEEYNERQCIAREEQAKQDEARRKRQERLEAELGVNRWDDHARASGLACPQCSEELIERSEVIGTRLMAWERFVDCPKCNFHGKKDGVPNRGWDGLWL